MWQALPDITEEFIDVTIVGGNDDSAQGSCTGSSYLLMNCRLLLSTGDSRIFIYTGGLIQELIALQLISKQKTGTILLL